MAEQSFCIMNRRSFKQKKYTCRNNGNSDTGIINSESLPVILKQRPKQ